MWLYKSEKEAMLRVSILKYEPGLTTFTMINKMRIESLLFECLFK